MGIWSLQAHRIGTIRDYHGLLFGATRAEAPLGRLIWNIGLVRPHLYLSLCLCTYVNTCV